MSMKSDFNRAIRNASREVEPVYKTATGQGSDPDDIFQYVPHEELDPKLRKALHNNELSLNVITSELTACGHVKIGLRLRHDAGHHEDLVHVVPLMEIVSQRGRPVGMTQRWNATLRYAWSAAAARLLSVEIKEPEHRRDIRPDATAPGPVAVATPRRPQASETSSEPVFSIKGTLDLLAEYDEREFEHDQAEGRPHQPIQIETAWQRMGQSGRPVSNEEWQALFYWLLEDKRRAA